MKFSHPVIAALALSLSCGPEPVSRPDVDPDDLSAEMKADFVSNYATTIIGDLVLGQTVQGKIGWPDWFHGYTFNLREAQTASFTVQASTASQVRVYGPATKTVNGAPKFGGPIYNKKFSKSLSFSVKAKTKGVYLLVYNPRLTWSASYEIASTCTKNCLPVDACTDHAQCAAGQYCGPNGVVCIMAPCLASSTVSTRSTSMPREICM
jgi:hypothetical protein